jgi:hypothetical protein
VVVRPIVTFAATVWWPRVKLKTSQAELTKLQRMACLGIKGALRTAPTAVLLGLPPLHLQVQAEAKARDYRLHCSDQWKPKFGYFGHDKMMQRHVYDKPFTIRYPDRSEWKERFQPNRKGGLIWYTDGSNINKSTGAGVYCHGMR